MKKLLLVAMAVLSLASFARAQNYSLKTLIQIQQVPDDSLAKADQLGIGASGNSWLLQSSPFTVRNGAYYKDSTVSVVALVTVPPHYIDYTATGMTMCLVDTGANGYKPWSGILVRYGGYSGSFDANGYNSIQRGDIIKIRGKISEFPTSSMNSFTQFEPDTTYQISILSSGNPIPPPAKLSISDFNIGVNPNGHVNIATGEKYEAKEVLFTGLTVVANVNTTRGTWMVTDDFGNQMSMYDWSHYFTLGHGSVVVPGDTSYHVPAIGTRIDTLRGYIATSSGSEAGRGYRICPIFPGDVVYGKLRPGLTTQRRYPVMVTPDSTPLVTAKVWRQVTASQSGAALNTIKLYYSVNNGSWQTVDMTAPQASKDSLYQATIPKQSAGALVKYFIRVDDADNQVVTLANSGSLTQYDTTQGFFFYNVINRLQKPVLSVADIQYTPFKNGRTSLIGTVDSVGGIVTVDTTSLHIAQLTTYHTNPYYIQNGNAPWSGIWVSGPDSILAKCAIGDSIIVTGYINENFDVTRVENITKMRVVKKGNAVPAPVKLSTDVFAAGSTTGEQYEGMLVSFDNAVVTDVAPVFQDPTEFEVSNGTKGCRVQLDGKNNFSITPADTAIGKTVLKVNHKIGTLTGVIYYSAQRYKLVPRTQADWQNLTSVKVEKDGTLPTEFALAQNYPNPFNPSTNIRFSIAHAQQVSLKIYDVLGREVETLVNGQMNPGTYTVQWNAKNISSGVYFYRLQSGNFVQTMKLMLMK